MELFKSRPRVVYTNAVGDKVYPVVVDIKKGIKSTEDIQFVSSDVNTGILSVAFIQGNDNYNVTGADVVCSVMRPDASTLELPCEVVRENIVEVPLGINGTSQDGVYSFDFKVFKGENKVVGTPIMNYSVSLSISNDMVVEEDDRLPVLTMLMTQVSELHDRTDEAVVKANTATEATKVATANAIEVTNKANETVAKVTQDTANAIAEVNATADTMVENVNDAISSMDTTVNDKISEMTDAVNNKISEVDTAKNDMINDVSSTKANMVNEVTNAKNEMTATVTNKVNEVEGRFNALTASQQQSSEVIDARDGETSLKARLDRDIEKAKQVYVNVEGSYISTDSSSGYLKDVEILGNTIQDASNLADIRSVGDKVEGQELYEIPVVTWGKNLLNPNDIEIFGSTNNDIKSYTITDETLVFSCPQSYNQAVLNIKMDLDTAKSYVVSGDVEVYVENIWLKVVMPKINVLNGYFTITFVKDWKAITKVKISNFQLEEGTVATPYEPYQEDKLTILSPVQLEKVGDVRDRIIEKDGVWGVEKNIKLININDLSVCDTISLKNWKERGCRINFRYANDIIYNDSKVSCIFNGILSVANSQLHNHTTFPTVNSGGLTSDGFIRIHLDIPLEYGEVNKANAIRYLKDLNLTMLVGTTQPQFIPLPHDQQVKLRTFANKTNISFGCEIEGTIKAQVPKSLGATVNTHTEQINNLNKELDRVKKLEESTVSTVTTESDFTTVEATSNGYFEDVKLEGKTLVVNANNEVVEPGTEGAMLKSVGDGADEIVVSSVKGDGNLIKSRLVFSDNEQIEGFSSAYRQFKIPVIKGRTYYLKAKVQTNSNWKDSLCKLYHQSKQGTHTVIYVSTYNNNNDLVDIDVSFVANDNYVVFEYYNNPSLDRNKSIYDNFDYLCLTSNPNLNPNIDLESDKKRLLFYNEETQTWEKPILREWDSIEKHSDGKYYYHKRSEECVLDGSVGTFNVSVIENNDYIRWYRATNTIIPKAKVGGRIICDTLNNETYAKLETRTCEGIGIKNQTPTDLGVTVLKSRYSATTNTELNSQLALKPITFVYEINEEVYECTNIDLITYTNETNYVVECGAIVPKSTLKVHNNISNVVSLLQKKVSLLESNVKASQEVQDMMILETDMRMLDIELALMEFAPMKLNLGGSNMLRSATYFNFLKNHIINETYEKEYLENVMNKYLATGRINQDEYDELYNMLYPPVYDIELPIEL